MGKNVKLVSLNLTYFKGVKKFDIQFNPESTEISGANATGKTTFFDAWSWLLFGKDSLGSAEFDIKTLRPDNTVINRVDHKVIGVLTVDGRKVELQKIFREEWVKPKGTLEEVQKGNINICYIDGVKVSVTDYKQYVDSLIDEYLFKLITNVHFFNSIKPELKKRDELTKIAGEVTDDFVVSIKPELSEFLKMLDGQDLTMFKKKIAAQKKLISSDLYDIPIRIDTLITSRPLEINFEPIERKIKSLENELTKIDIAIGDSQKAFAQKNEGVQKLYAEINELTNSQMELVNSTNQTNQKKVFDDNSTRRELENKISIEKREIYNLNTEAQNLGKDEARINAAIAANKEKRAVLLKEWNDENKSVYQKKNDCLICPAFGHKCSDEDALFKFNSEETDVELIFNKSKSESLSDIEKRGSELKIQTTNLESQLSSVQKQMMDALNLASEKNLLTVDMQIELAAMPVSEYTPIIPTEIKEWNEKQILIDEVKAKISNLKTDDTDNSELLNSKIPIGKELDELKLELNKKDQISNSKKLVEEYEAKIKSLNVEKAELEKLEHQEHLFTKTKIEEVDKRINGMFSYVTFKLFETTQEGNENECCKTLIDGIPYDSANNAARINAGIDIINVLSKHYEVSAPIWIDNAESVNSIIPTDAQVVRLVVTRDPNLSIN